MAAIAQRPEGLRSLCHQESFTKVVQELFVMLGAGEICGIAEATPLNNPWACTSTIAVARPLPPDFCMTSADRRQQKALAASKRSQADGCEINELGRMLSADQHSL